MDQIEWFTAPTLTCSAAFASTNVFIFLETSLPSNLFDPRYSYRLQGNFSQITPMQIQAWFTSQPPKALEVFLLPSSAFSPKITISRSSLVTWVFTYQEQNKFKEIRSEKIRTLRLKSLEKNKLEFYFQLDTLLNTEVVQN